MSGASPAIVALVGPTASGKSRVAFEAARVTGAHIVAVDAFTVYRGMDVGTAKPSARARRQVPHHMIDVCEPEQACTVEWFQAAARRAIERVQAGDSPVLLVGGSGLYFRAVVEDLVFPPTDEAVRAAVVTRVGGSAAQAHAELRRRDPAAATRMTPTNLRRAVRALEVLDLTGRPFSEWRTAWDDHRSRYPGLRVVGIARDRAELDVRIADRSRAMVTGGLLDEARALADRQLSVTARAAIGYQEAFDHLAQPPSAREPADLVEAIRLRTRRYAVRQQRWFARDPRIRWVAGDRATEEVITACSS